jgi:hypothetical protein
MSIFSFFSWIGLLVLIGALLVSCLLYLKNIKTKIVSIANMCSLLVFLVSLVFVINILAHGLNDPAELARMLAATILMDLYAGICNVAARVWVRIVELMGNKRVKISVHAEIVER